MQFLVFPASWSTAWQYQSIAGYRKPNFIGDDMAAVIGLDGGWEHVSQNGRLKSGCVGVHKEEQRIVAEQFLA